MFKKMTVTAALVVMMMAPATIQKIQAQEAGAAKPAPEAAKAENAYRLDFSVNEMEDGKKVNTRQYLMNLNSNSSNEIKIGTRVPLEPENGQFQYIDVGTTIWSRIEDRNGQVNLEVRAELSNFALPEQSEGHAAHPVIRQMKIGGGTLATLGKPMLIGSVDDPNSKRQFQLEATVTKLR